MQKSIEEQLLGLAYSHAQELTADSEIRDFLEQGESAVLLLGLPELNQAASTLVRRLRELVQRCIILVLTDSPATDAHKELLTIGAREVLQRDENGFKDLEGALKRASDDLHFFFDSEALPHVSEGGTHLTNNVLSDIGSIIVRVSARGRVVWWNGATEELTGISVSAASGRFVDDLDVPFLSTALAVALKSPGRQRITVGELEAVDQKAKTLWLKVELVPLVEGEIHNGWLVHAIDITDLRTGRKSVEESHEILRQLTDNIDDVFWVYDIQSSRWLFVSPSYETIWDRPLMELDSDPKTWVKSVISGDIPDIETLPFDAVNMRPFEFSFTIERAGVPRVILRDRFFPVYSRRGRVERVARITTDITEETEAKEQLERTHKLEAIGQMAAGIAHEINTPTQYVTDNVRFIQDAFQDIQGLFAEMRNWLITKDPTVEKVESSLQQIDAEYLESEIPRALDQTIEGLQRISRIVGAMKDFSHPGIETFQLMDINSALETSATITHNEWKYLADVVFDLDSELPQVPCLASEVHQVFVNMIVNAAHAILERRTRSESRDWRGQIKISTRSLDGMVAIEFSDTGCGIPEKDLKNIFELFFTTKPVGKGTGQGLALCRSVIEEKHQGAIEIETAMGQGTTFRIKIPTLQQADQP